MRNFSKSVFLPLLVVFATFISCKKESNPTVEPGDTSPPTIVVVTPTQEENFTGGNAIPFKATFSDNISLSEYRIEMHSDFDGHSHEKLTTVPFYFDTIVFITGKQHTGEFPIQIPLDVTAGKYHFMVTCIDAAGNEAEFVELDLQIQNSSDIIPPILSLTSPDTSSSLLTVNFETDSATFLLPILGTISDDQEIKGYSIVFTQHNTSPEPIPPIYERTNLNLTGISYVLNETLILRKADLFSNEHYELIITVVDHVGNRYEWETEVEVFIP
jgi:hypothetical protein